MGSSKAKDLRFLPRILNPGFLKTPTGIFWWLVASHVFQPLPEKQDLQSDTWWLGGWVAGCWWLVAATPLHKTNHQPPPTSHRWSCGWNPGGWWLVSGGSHVTKILNLEIITTTRKKLFYLVFKGALGFTLVIMRKQKSWMSFCVAALWLR